MADEERDEKSRDIKVTDRRMFTPDGKLKDEYRWLEEAEAPAGAATREPEASGDRDETAPAAEPGSPSPATGESRDRPGGESPEPRRAAPQGAAPEATHPGASTPPGASRPESSGESAPAPTGTPIELPDTPDSMGKPGFLDLLAVLAEPATIYLGDAALPDGRQAEDLRAARLYIDMLTVLREKTSGNLAAQEQAVMDDLLYRLQMRYIQKRG